jgi:hypothetical protein
MGSCIGLRRRFRDRSSIGGGGKTLERRYQPAWQRVYARAFIEIGCATLEQVSVVSRPELTIGPLRGMLRRLH